MKQPELSGRGLQKPLAACSCLTSVVLSVKLQIHSIKVVKSNWVKSKTGARHSHKVS